MLPVAKSAKVTPARFSGIVPDSISVPAIPALARTCGHTHMNQFNRNDLTWHKKMTELSGVNFAGNTGASS